MRLGRWRPWMARSAGLVLSVAACTSLAATAAATAAAAEGTTPRDMQSLQQDLERIRRETGVPALGVAVVDETGALWTSGLGRARRADAQPATSESLFRMGSVSKMVAALAAMTLVEQGRLDLQMPLRHVAPEVAFENPWETTHPVRLVHLLEHTTGWEDLHPSEAVYAAPDDLRPSQALAVRPATRHSRWIPGTRSAYSNIGTLVLAHVVEKVSGMPFEAYVHQAVLGPLGMRGSSYFEDERFRARGVELFADGAPQQALPYAHMLDRAAGALNSSPADMGRLLQMLLRQGALPDGQSGVLLRPETLARMRTPTTTLGAAQGLQVGYGLGHESTSFGRSSRLFHGHNGAVTGGLSQLVYEPSLGRGYVLMQSNDNFSAFFRLSRRLHEHLLAGRASEAAAPPQRLPDAWRDMGGWYRHVTPRRELTRLTEDLTDLSHVEVRGDGLRQTYLMGGEDRFEARGGPLLVDARTGLPMLARVQDPLAGTGLQVGANTFQRVPAVAVFGVLALLAGWLVSVPAQGLYLAVDAWRRRQGRQTPLLSARLLLLVAAVSLLVALGVSLVLGQGDEPFGRLTAVSLTLCLGSLAFALLTLLSAGQLWRVWRRSSPVVGRWEWWGGLIPLGLQLGVLAYLASYGMVGVRTWV